MTLIFLGDKNETQKINSFYTITSNNLFYLYYIS